MLRDLLPILLVVAASVVTVLQVAIYAPSLPDPMASHFNSAGVADGWMPKSAFLPMMVGLQLGLAVFFLGLGWAIGKLPSTMINIPHREYWLSEERVSETLSYNRQMMNWLAALTAGLLLLMFQLTIQANLAEPSTLPLLTVWSTVGLYLLAVFWCVGCLVRRFSRIPAGQQSVPTTPGETGGT